MNQKDRVTLNQILDAYDIKEKSPEFYETMTDFLCGREIKLPESDEKTLKNEDKAPETLKDSSKEPSAAPKESSPEPAASEPSPVAQPEKPKEPVLPEIHTDPKKAQGVGLVLDGGGGKGAYQLGVIKALSENGLLDDVTMVSGASIGAVNAMLFAMEDIDLMYRAWSDIKLLSVFDFDADTLSRGKLYFSRDEMVKLIHNYIDFKKLKESRYDIYTALARVNGTVEHALVNSDYTAEYRRLNDYDEEIVKKLVLASSAMPIVYEPVEINGFLYRDGGLVDNSPIQPLYDAGIRQFIVIGMKHGKELNTDKWPDAHFITLYPSCDLGEVLTGTLNFDKRAIEFRQLLGYKDGLRSIKTKFRPDDMYIRMEPTLAESDLQDIKAQMHVNQTYENLSGNISSNIDKFNEIASKYENF